MDDNIFIHDASPTWSGFLYQGQIGVYLALKKICDLIELGEESEIEKYSIEMEYWEDIAVVYEDKAEKKYVSIHQVKNEGDTKLAKYRAPFIQLMLEKGYLARNGLGKPEAYLHVSREIKEKNIAGKAADWREEILKFYEKMDEMAEETKKGNMDEKKWRELEEYVRTDRIGISRKKYKDLLNAAKKLCEKRDIAGMAIKLEEIMDLLKNGFCIPEICSGVQLYTYENGECHCCGTETFSKIVELIRRYKGSTETLREEEYGYIADRVIRLVRDKILERHRLLQEKKDASQRIALKEFKKLLDEGMDKYNEEANILALMRIYDECLEEYCRICQEDHDCQGSDCRLQHPDYRRNTLEKDAFIKFCYNLNPECAKKIEERECLHELLDKDGMTESVFLALKEIPERFFVEREDKTHFEIMNRKKAAFLTAITGKRSSVVVENIDRAIKTNQNLIETIFEADQLVTSRLTDSSSAWDRSCVKIRPDDLTDGENESADSEEHGIFVAKKPEFITSEQLINSVGEQR